MVRPLYLLKYWITTKNIQTTMKKLFLLLAIAGVMASCGGEEKKSVEEQAKAYINEMKAAAEAGDQEKFEKIAEESQAWYDGLSDADKAAADKVMNTMM